MNIERTQFKYEGKDQGDASGSHAKEHQRLPANHQKLPEEHETDSPSQPSEEANSANTLISGFQSPETQDNFCCISH